ncbi:MAG: tRNA epoxyqueuosine(34) reductase QueG [Fimbriimonadaceae bacterium]|nr:tRNA epoxyqueuosine(34) reductase QueG [Fimbriimonadaceae bacterium]QYK57073.1 MAG: tRNA epoxyqueuosine(34) reductase QueG [Fimbriimonadaceae bacterium]
MAGIKDEVVRRAQAEGFDLVGVCAAEAPATWPQYAEWVAKGFHGEMTYLAKSLDLRKDLEGLLPGARSVLAFALNYNQPNPPVNGVPRIARYALGRDYHKVLRSKLKRIGTWLEERETCRWRVCVDSAPILEREFAHRAGLGWFGKNSMLINSQRGSWFLIGLLLTSLSLEPDRPAIGGCGRCRACIDACPTGCIVFEDGRWQIEARRCISYLTIEKKGDIDPELKGLVGDWTFGCDVCQEVCPFNQPRQSQPLRAVPTREPGFLATRVWPTLERLRVIQPEEWDVLTQGSPVRRAGLEGLRRNARTNLENGQA